MWIATNDRYERWDLEGFPEIITDELPEGETAQTPTYFWQLKKVAEIKQHYAILGTTLEHGGHVWQTDATAQQRITSVYSALDGGLITTPPQWRTLDNQMVQMSASEFTSFALAVLSHQQVTFATMVGHIDAVRGLTTIEAVQGYTYG